MKVTLTTDLLVAAYSHGYFPMPHPETEEICWFHPDPRAVLPLDRFHVSRSLRRTMSRVPFRITFDQDFSGVLEGCADRKETWINDEIKTAFIGLFRDGYGHSVEVWLDDALVGGTYGIAIGGAFFAESMFHRMTDASKVALYALTEQLKKQGYSLLEVQFLTKHLTSLGAIEIPASDYVRRLQEALKQKRSFLNNAIQAQSS